MPEELTLDQLRENAMAEIAKPAPPTESEEQSATEEQATADATVYRYEIDLGDGSGKQVFEGESYEDLIEKLGKAQEHATRKIRELSAQTKREEPAAPKETIYDVEREYAISQELLAAPSKAFKQLFEQTVGVPIDRFKTDLQRVQAFERAQTEHESAQAFMEAHPEYYPTPHNGRVIEGYVKTMGLDPTPENIETAFKALTESGLLQSRPEKEGETESASRIAATTEQPRRKVASGVTARRGMDGRYKTAELTEQDTKQLSTEQLQELAVKEFLGLGS